MLNPNANYDKQIVRAPRGTARRTESLGQTQVPDMWHLYITLHGLAEKIAVLDESEDEEDEDRLIALQDAIAAIDPSAIGLANPVILKRQSEMVKETWHLAHDLKANLAGDV